MRRFLPYIAGIFVFLLALSLQVIWEKYGNQQNQVTQKSLPSEDLEKAFRNIQLETFDGDHIKLSEQKAPYVLLNFWASWCVPCLKEFPSLVKLRKNISEENLLVVGINNDLENPRSVVKKFIKKYQLNFPQVLDKDESLTDFFHVSTLPTSILFYKGKLVRVDLGEQNFNSQEYLGLIKTNI